MEQQPYTSPRPAEKTISGAEFAKRSLSLHLFFARIMKEHSFFMQTSFTQKDQNLINQADYFRKSFAGLLMDAVAVSNGAVSKDVLASGELITQYTLKAETASSFLTGVPLDTEITRSEAALTGDGFTENPALDRQVQSINSNAMSLTRQLIQFKTGVLSSVLSCNVFTTNYPSLLHHVTEEAEFYLSMTTRLQNREDVNPEKEAFMQETFWDDIMEEHAEFIRGMLDPTEMELIIKANDLAYEMEDISEQLKQAADKMAAFRKVTNDTYAAVKRLRDFKTAGTQGILECKVKSVIIPLLSDHVLREANHYLRLLGMYQRL
ncbi:MAG: DUF2935 domain-containing protein [Bacillota bacterium]|nr:DUF2935 domain-containing protein [Bacillota bacterium]